MTIMNFRPVPPLTARLLLSLAIPLLASANVITTTYDASLGTLPGTQGFNSFVDSPITPNISGGILDVDAYTQGVDSRGAFYTRSNGTFFMSSFVMESSLQIIRSTQRGTPGGGSYPRAGFLLDAADNNGKSIQVEIVEGGFWLQTSDGTAFSPPASSFFSFDTTDAFHTYRLEADGSLASLFLDHSSTPVLSMTIGSLQNSGGQSEVGFGDGSSLARSHFELQYFMFSSDLSAQAAPEPGTAVMAIPALAALLGFAARANRRKSTL